LKIITTKQWGAKPVDNSRLSWSPAEGVIIHHTAGANAWPLPLAFLERQRCFRVARAIQKDHIDRGWSDSGHHFLVTRSGLILEGRQGTLNAAQLHSQVIQGAHAGVTHVNRTCWGIECEGRYTKGPMPERQMLALVELCAHLCCWGELQTSETISGHRDVKATECPGDWLYQMLPGLRSMVHHRKWDLMSENDK